MTQADAATPGYRYDGETVAISQKLTEKQFREIEEILGRDRERFKEWADKFYFDPPTPPLAEQLRAYLRERQILHDVERRETFVLDELEPQAASA